MSTFITRLSPTGSGPRLAVKDVIDMEGLPTTAGSRALANRATPATADAPCLAGARAAGARIVGRTNLHELAMGGTGINPWFGTPVNPLDPRRIPGGSSSGSAVAVATEEADVAYGTDTGGSVRIPSACCGTAGLKTTWGRVPLAGVWPLAPSLDTVGPMARDVAGLVVGMELLEPGFTVDVPGPTRVGRLADPACDPRITAALDEALARTGWEVVEIEIPEWGEATGASASIIVAELWASDGALLAAAPDEVSPDLAGLIRAGERVSSADLEGARSELERLRATMAQVFDMVELVATPTLPIFPTLLDEPEDWALFRHTMPVNLTGVPAISVPVPSGGPFPASLQLVGPCGAEAQLLAAGSIVEAAVS
ncbi:MAG TPA: amidase [Acidimicrobiales bacterium]|nr:amidase [Acidimicrobiales bacterium]